MKTFEMRHFRCSFPFFNFANHERVKYWF